MFDERDDEDREIPRRLRKAPLIPKSRKGRLTPYDRRERKIDPFDLYDENEEEGDADE